MSLPTPATDLFLRGWNPDQTAPQMLVRVELTVPTALTLYWCVSPLAGASPLVVNPGGYSWQPVILDGDPIHAPGGLLDPGPSLVVTGFRIANVRLIPQSSGTAADLFADYVVRGATVTMWLWHAGLTSFATDALQVFKGVIQSATIEQDAVSFRCQQRKNVNVTVPPNRVNKTTEPNAPESSLGLPKPLVYGQFVNDGMDEPWASPYPTYASVDAKIAQEDVGAGGLVIPGILVDSGVGGTDGRVLFADHPLKQIGNKTGQVNVKIAAGQSLASFNSAGIATDILPDGSGMYLKDEENVAFIGVPSIDVRLTGTAFPNTALLPRAAMEVFDETTYAILQSSGAHERLALVVGNVGSPGEMIGAEIVIGYRTSHTTSPAKVRYGRPDYPAGGPSPDIALTAHNAAPVGEPVVQRVPLTVVNLAGQTSWAAGIVSTDWNTGAGDLLVFLNPATAGHYIHVFFIGLVIKYRPSQGLVTPSQGDDRAIRFGHGHWWSIGRFPSGVLPPGWYYLHGRFTPAVYEAQGQFFTNALGREDTTGAYTGAALELLERPSDIIQHLLEVYGGEAASSIETAVNRFGSFARARARNVSVEGNPITLGVHVGAETQLYPLLARIATQAPGWLYLSRFDDRWHFVPWDRRALVADFPRALEASDILESGINAVALSETQLVNDVSVPFAYDFFRNRSMHAVSAGPAASDGGLASRGKRDQLLKIEISGAGQNNRIDLVRSAVTYAPSLNGATYTPTQMMVEAKRSLVALAIGGATWNVGWGGAVVAGHNDRVDFVIGGTTYAATVAPGSWLVGELVYQVQLAMGAVGDPAADVRVGLGMYVLEGVNEALDFNDGTAKKVSLPPGYYKDGHHLARDVQSALNLESSNWTCTYSAGTGKFTIGRTSGVAQLLWLSGANAAHSCAALLGYSHVADDTGAASYVADYARTRGRVHVQAKLSVVIKSLTGTNKANSVAVSIGFDQAADTTAMNHEGTYPVQDETFAISEITAFSLLWQSGVNAATSAAHVLGFKVASDDAAVTRHLADRRRSDRETRAARSRAYYGPKEPENVVALDVRATEVALNLRDIVLDLLAEGPVILSVKSHRFPDLERGRILPLGDLSSLVTRPPRYGADSWDGMLFRAVEVAQYWGRSWHQEIVLVEEQNPIEGASIASVDVGPPTVNYAAVIWRTAVSTLFPPRMRAIAADGSVPVLETIAGTETVSIAGGAVEPTRVISNGDGSMIGAWITNGDRVAVQKVNAAGTALWGANGLFVDDGATSPQTFMICADGVLGCYVAWTDLSSNVFLVRVDSTGAFPAGWALGGIVLHASGQKDLAHVCPDGSGGAIVTWVDRRSGTRDIYVQRVNSAGAVQWAAGGVLLSSTDTKENWRPDIVGDGTGAAYVAWEYRATGLDDTGNDIHVQKVSSAGAVAWTAGGVPLCVGQAGTQGNAQVVIDGTGGAIVCWADNRSGSRVYAQRVNSSGAVQWSTNGVNVMASNSAASATPRMISDGDGGAILVNDVTATDDIRAQRIDSGGTLLWAAAGVVVAPAAAGGRVRPRIAPDGAGGVIVVWDENNDIYAQRLNQYGELLWSSGVIVASGAVTQHYPNVGT